MPAGSGVGVDDECIIAFNELKSKKAFRYLIFAIVDNSIIKIKKRGSRDASYDEFRAELAPTDPCYAVYDFEFESEEGKRGRLCFVSWIPDVAKVKPKMVYASSKDSLKTKIEGGIVEIQATDASEITYDAVLAKVKATFR